jgi:hypothetical protein
MITAMKGGDEDRDKIILSMNLAADFGQDLKMLAWDKTTHGVGGVGGQEGIIGVGGEGSGADIVFGSTTMITATKGGVKDKEENKIILCANPSIDSGQDLKMLAWDRLMRGGGGTGQEGVGGWDGNDGGYGGALGLVYSGCGGPSIEGKTTRKSPPEELLIPSLAVRDKATLALGDAIQSVLNVDPKGYQCGVGVVVPLAGQFCNISNAPHFGSVPTAPPLFQISDGQSAAKISETEKTDINPLSILEGGSAAKNFEPNEKEGEVMIITQTAGKYLA